MAKKRTKCIGILTSGGDCPGLNAAIRGVGKAAMVFGIVLRGSAFIFRQYDSTSDAVQHRWGKVFGAACFITPFSRASPSARWRQARFVS